MLTLSKHDIEQIGGHRGDRLIRRVEQLRERVVGQARAQGTFGVDDVVFDDGATLLLHGEVNLGTTPHLDTVLDGVISLQPSSLTVDLTKTTGVSFDALITIVRRASKVERLTVRLRPAPSLTLMNLLRDLSTNVASTNAALHTSAPAIG